MKFSDFCFRWINNFFFFLLEVIYNKHSIPINNHELLQLLVYFACLFACLINSTTRQSKLREIFFFYLLLWTNVVYSFFKVYFDYHFEYREREFPDLSNFHIYDHNKLYHLHYFTYHPKYQSMHFVAYYFINIGRIL